MKQKENILKKISAIQSKIIDLVNTTNINMDLLITDLYGNEPNTFTSRFFVSMQFHDCVELSNACEICTEAKLFNNKVQIKKILELSGVGFIAINKYDLGTNINFVIQENNFEIENNIEITCPGVGNTLLTIGKEYYIGVTKYNDEFKGSNNLKKRELLKIKSIDNGYEFYFSGIKTPIISYTRGHVLEAKKILNRTDYVVVSEIKSIFISNMIEKIGMDLIFVDSQKEEDLFEILNKIIQLRNTKH